MANNQSTERRIGPDFLSYLFYSATILSWLSFLVAIILFHFARPERDFGIVRYYGIPIRKVWLEPWADWLILGLVICASLSMISLFLARIRQRRKVDAPNKFSLILLSLATLSWLGYFWL